MKKFFTIMGIILLFSTFSVGSYIFIERHNNNELLKNPSIQPVTSVDEYAINADQKEFNKNKFSLSDPASVWVVVNKKRPLSPSNYEPNDLIALGNNQKLRKEAAQWLTKLINDAKSEDLTINPLSGYRSYDTQVTVYGNEVKNYGQAIADSESARPGYSEHQTGLAIDVGGGGCGIEDCFGNTAEGIWLAENAYKYGYIVRYTEDKQTITGYRAEPWHIRYIGTELSLEMQTKNIKTLEEFFGLPSAPNY